LFIRGRKGCKEALKKSPVRATYFDQGCSTPGIQKLIKYSFGGIFAIFAKIQPDCK